MFIPFSWPHSFTVCFLSRLVLGPSPIGRVSACFWSYPSTRKQSTLHIIEAGMGGKPTGFMFCLLLGFLEMRNKLKMRHWLFNTNVYLSNALYIFYKYRKTIQHIFFNGKWLVYLENQHLKHWSFIWTRTFGFSYEFKHLPLVWNENQFPLLLPCSF